MGALEYIGAFGGSFLLAWLLTAWVRRLALKTGIVDRPDADPTRKIHRQPVPELGGLAIFLTTAAGVGFFSIVNDQLLGGYLLPKHLIGVLLAGAVIMFGGYLDDRYHLGARQQILFPIIAAAIVIVSGISVDYISNPFGDAIRLDTIQFTVFTWNDAPYSITLWSDFFVFVWLMGMMYTTKFLDGLDGLAIGVGSIGALIVFFLSLTFEVGQPETALLALLFAGAGIGFLMMNFNPARIFLGEGGSVFVGFWLGVLAIISGAKIATALLIMGIPILDVIWVIVRRVFFEKTSATRADRKHLHFRLLDIGFSQRQAVVFLYVLTATFGLTSLLLTGKAKVMSLVVLVAVMVVLGAAVVMQYRKRRATNDE